VGGEIDDPIDGPAEGCPGKKPTLRGANSEQGQKRAEKTDRKKGTQESRAATSPHRRVA